MSVHFIAGKPGGGKTLYAMRLLIAELRVGSRAIVTNIAINFEGLNEYLQKEGIDLGSEHIRDRITIITEEQLREFYLYRGRGILLPWTEKVESDGAGVGVGKKRVPDYSQARGGVLYLLDEIHIAFNARAWASTGQNVIYYLSQHRKLGDDVICITQAVMNVDKQMRSVAQDYTYIRNFGKEKMGLFRLPSLFMRRTFLEPATDTTRPTESGTFRLDVAGIAGCYDTAAGVGIHGRTGADIGQKSRGLHWAWYFVGIIVAILGIQKASAPFAEWVTTGGNSAERQARLHVRPAAQSAPAVPQPPAPAQASASVPAALAVPQVASVTNTLRVTGVSQLFGDTTVFLSDGRTLKASAGEVQIVDHNYVIAQGLKIPFASGPH